eukprot:TRINITY_DN4781_c0_g1_i1.p1 TRINITY_DN4781_c0_g1~~TRINITY_DN4781_c0_g1_i1.p1  ORF type:complete len:430 (+),score=90.56 TRINITY_DN4781_c0_g1_i1:56-1291(+)
MGSGCNKESPAVGPQPEWECYVGCDLYGRKENVRLVFPACPTLAQLTRETEQVLGPLAASCCPTGVSPFEFAPDGFRLYVPSRKKWVQLLSEQQLSHSCQLYVFQPESHWTHSNVPAQLPPPIDTADAQAARLYGLKHPLAAKARSVFRDLDVAGKGYIDVADVRLALRAGPGVWRGGLKVTTALLSEWFAEAETPGTGRVSYRQWVRFARSYPAVVDALFHRANDTYVHHGDVEVTIPQYMRTTETWRNRNGRSVVDTVARRRRQELATGDPLRCSARVLEEGRMAGLGSARLVSERAASMAAPDYAAATAAARASALSALQSAKLASTWSSARTSSGSARTPSGSARTPSGSWSPRTRAPTRPAPIWPADPIPSPPELPPPPPPPPSAWPPPPPYPYIARNSSGLAYLS